MKLHKYIHTLIALHYKKNLTPRNIKILSVEYWIIMEQINGRTHWYLHGKCIVKGIPVKQAKSSNFYKLFITFLADIRKLKNFVQSSITYRRSIYCLYSLSETYVCFHIQIHANMSSACMFLAKSIAKYFEPSYSLH